MSKPYETDEFGMQTSCCDGGKMCAVNNSGETLVIRGGESFFGGLSYKPIIVDSPISDESEVPAPPFTPNGDVSVTLGEREATHGPFKLNAECTQRAEEVYRSMPGYSQLDYTQRESLHMTLHKLARWVNGNSKHSDHLHDAKGYIALAEQG
jgi:hypothetical protein